MDKTRSWLALLRRLPKELLSDLADFVQVQDADSILAFLEEKETEAADEEQNFIQTHRELDRLSQLGRSLADDEQAQVDWFEEELNKRHAKTRQIQWGVRDAREIADFKSYYPSETEDA
jgi:hypothetical protein